MPDNNSPYQAAEAEAAPSPHVGGNASFSSPPLSPAQGFTFEYNNVSYDDNAAEPEEYYDDDEVITESPVPSLSAGAGAWSCNASSPSAEHHQYADAHPDDDYDQKEVSPRCLDPVPTQAMTPQEREEEESDEEPRNFITFRTRTVCYHIPIYMT